MKLLLFALLLATLIVFISAQADDSTKSSVAEVIQSILHKLEEEHIAADITHISLQLQEHFTRSKLQILKSELPYLKKIHTTNAALMDLIGQVVDRVLAPSRTGTSVGAPAESCYRIQLSNQHAHSKGYFLDPNQSGHPLQAYCDMNTANLGGGWTYIGQLTHNYKVSELFDSAADVYRLHNGPNKEYSGWAHFNISHFSLMDENKWSMLVKTVNNKKYVFQPKRGKNVPLASVASTWQKNDNVKNLEVGEVLAKNDIKMSDVVPQSYGTGDYVFMSKGTVDHGVKLNSKLPRHKVMEFWLKEQRFD